jgi:hypothetical protein
MPEPRDPLKEKGFAELSNVMGRLSRRAGMQLEPEKLNQAAQHIYYGNSEGPLPPHDPLLRREEWQKLGRIGDYRAEQPHDVDIVFGQRAGDLREKMRENRIGGGFTQQDLDDRTARRKADPNRSSFWWNLAQDLTGTSDYKPSPGELSPGDQQSHRWMGDREFMDTMATRKPGSYAANEGVQSGLRSPGYGGAKALSSELPLDTAVRYYQQSIESPDRAFGSYHGDPFGTANYQAHAGLQQMVYAMQSPDYAVGRALTGMAPLNQFANAMTMKNPNRQDPVFMQGSLNPLNRNVTGLGTMVGAPLDFLRGLGESIVNDEIHKDIADAMDQPSNLWTQAISPILTEEAGTAEERDDVIRRQQDQYADVDNGIGFDEYHRAKTGEYPSYLGKAAGSGFSELLDPFTAASALYGGTGIKALAGMLLREPVEEGITGVPFGVGADVAIGNHPPVQNLATPGLAARTELHDPEMNPQSNMSPSDFKDWAGSQDSQLRATSEALRQRTKTKDEMTRDRSRDRFLAPNAMRR